MQAREDYRLCPSVGIRAVREAVRWPVVDRGDAREETEGTLWVTPINEISYYTWSGGEVGYMAPFGSGARGRAEARAGARGNRRCRCDLEVDAYARIFTVDPLVRQHDPAGRTNLQAGVDFFNRQVVTEAFDLLAGRLEPELGGSRRHLGVVGLNYYACNQWTVPARRGCLPLRITSRAACSTSTVSRPAARCG